MNKFNPLPNVRGLRTPLDNSSSANECKAPSGNRSAPVGEAKDSEIDERALVRSAQQGDLQAFNRLVLACQDRAYTQACYLVGDPVAAEDVVQEAFIAVYKALPTYRGGSFRSWLFRIVTNKCLDELRRRKRHPTVALQPETVDGREIESPYWVADPGESPEDSLLKSELSRQIRSCVERLTPDRRTILVLVDLLGMTYEEAARVVGCRLGTVKSRLARARVQMRSYLRDSPVVSTYEFLREPSSASVALQKTVVDPPAQARPPEAGA